MRQTQRCEAGQTETTWKSSSSVLSSQRLILCSLHETCWIEVLSSHADIFRHIENQASYRYQYQSLEITSSVFVVISDYDSHHFYKTSTICLQHKTLPLPFFTAGSCAQMTPTPRATSTAAPSWRWSRKPDALSARDTATRRRRWEMWHVQLPFHSWTNVHAVCMKTQENPCRPTGGRSAECWGVHSYCKRQGDANFLSMS